MFCNYIPVDGYQDYKFYIKGEESTPNFDTIHNNYEAEYWHVFNADHEIMYDFQQDEYDNLLIVKDSYSNPLGILLAQHFNKTYLYDPRHIEESLEDYISKNNIDIVLFLTHDYNFSSTYYNKFEEYIK